MKPILRRAVIEGGIILVVAAAAGLAVNHARTEGIPLIADAEAFRVRTNAEFMTAKDAFRFFEEGSALFLDARGPDLFDVKRIEGAMNISPSAEGIESVAWLAGADIRIICYACEENQREAGVLADMLLEIGCKQVYVLHGGIEGWIDSGFPMEVTG
ncbi:MAG: rhodanese-like domain-containing protein [Candidatus Eisenbacteria bacterium]